MSSRFVIALLCASVFAVPAVADDSSAALGMGGLQFTKAANIRMAKEDLFISPNAVRIRYEFANDGSADVDSIVAFPLPDIDGVMKEMEYGFETLKADGIGIYTNDNQTRWPGDGYFDPMWKELNRRNAIVYMHPLAPPCCTNLNDSVPTRATCPS